MTCYFSMGKWHVLSIRYIQHLKEVKSNTDRVQPAT